MHVLLDLNAVHRNLFFAHVEYLKVEIETSILGPFSFVLVQNLVVAINLDAEEVSTFLPMHSAVGYVEEVLDAYFVAGGYFYQGDTCWYILVFGHPVTLRKM